MSLFGSLFTGVSGLNSQSRQMATISDNLANVNTDGYKRAENHFANLVIRAQGAQTYTAGGVRDVARYNIDRQGLLEATASGTDAAIDGAGFFVVNEQATGAGTPLYTRSGSFEPDEDGNLFNVGGFYLMGWRVDPDGEILDRNNLEVVNTRIINGISTPTTEVGVAVNLDAGETATAAAGYAAGDLADGTETAAFSVPVQIYDSLGVAHDVTVAFVKDSAGPNSWFYEVFADPAEVEAASHADGLLASGSATFNGNGTLNAVTLTAAVAPAGTGDFQIDWLDAGGADNSEISLDLGSANLTDGLSQLDDAYDIGLLSQNGTGVGLQTGTAIDKDGYVVSTFTNGDTMPLYRIALADFPAVSQLEPRSGNVFLQTRESGAPTMRIPGVGRAGTVLPSSLENSNVDIAEEFTRMIVTQRAYSANARVISTTDEMLDELIRTA